MSEAWVALIAAMFGGAGLKVIEYILNKSKSRSDVATQIRDELRTDLQNVRREVEELEGLLDVWKTRYFILVDALSYAKSALFRLGAQDDIQFIEEKVDKASVVMPLVKSED